MDNIAPETTDQVAAVASDEELRCRVLEATDKRIAGEILAPAGLFAIRYLAATLIQGDGAITPADALIAVLNAIWARIGSQPGQRLNSLALIGKRMGGEAYTGADVRFYANNEQPMFRVSAAPPPSPPPDSALLTLLRADHANTLAPKLRRDARGLKAFLAKHGREDALETMATILWRHATEGTPSGSVTSWKYFEAAIAEEKQKKQMTEDGVRPGDVFCVHNRRPRSDAA
jgi:hypothetical protein